MAALTRAARTGAAAAAFGAGVVAAISLAGCSQDGSVAEKASTAIGTLSATLPTRTQTREALTEARTEESTEASTEAATEATTEESTAAETVVEAEPAATAPAAPAVTTPTPTPPAVAAPATTAEEAPKTTEEAATTEAPATTTATELAAVAPAPDESTDAWVWALIVGGAALLAGLIVWAVRRRSTRRVLAEQEHAVGATVASWTAQGWVIETQSTRSAVLRRHGERVAVDVDRDGSVTSRRLDSLDDLA